jgi:hypothetical protein
LAGVVPFQQGRNIVRQLGVLMTATQKRLLLALTAVTALATATPTTSSVADGSDLCFAEGMPVVGLDGDGNPVFLHAGCPFTSLLDQTLFTLNGLLYRVENASQPWSCEQYDTNLFRFELRSGDIQPNPGGLLSGRRYRREGFYIRPAQL